MLVLLVVIAIAFVHSFPVGEVISDVLRTIPHDDQCFTQGLVVYNGELLESCGLYGRSSLRRVDKSTGKVLQKVNLHRDIFAEGIAVVDDRIYMLSWKKGKVFVYSATDLSYQGVRQFRTQTGEGWGLTTDGTRLIASDGSENVYGFEVPKVSQSDAVDQVGTNAAYLVEEFRYRVFDPITGRHISLVNELEYHNGNVYANIWYKDVIIRFNATTGRINERYDASRLYPKSKRSPSADCLNGIAYDDSDGSMILTGKKWPRYYKVNFTEMDLKRQLEL